MKIHFMSAKNYKSKIALTELQTLNENYSLEEADVIVVLSGDGTLLHAIHNIYHYNKPIYAMNCGDIGFLTNEYNAQTLHENLKTAIQTTVHPLKLKCTDANEKEASSIAINEVYLLRQSQQAAKLKITINQQIVMKKLIADGLIIASEIGSTAYNFSANGPIIPIGSGLLSIVALSPFRPRNWRGALIKDDALFEVDILDYDYRPVTAVADYVEFANIKKISVYQDKNIKITLLSNKQKPLHQKIFNEQFTV